MSGKETDQYLANWWCYVVDVEQFKGWDGNLNLSPGIPSVAIFDPLDGAQVALGCLDSDLTIGSAVDFETPGAGSAWFYLVTGESSGGEGPRGNDSSGAPRAATSICF